MTANNNFMRSKEVFALNTNLSPEEKQTAFIEVFDDYLNGKISLDDLRSAEREYLPNYIAATQELYKSSKQISRKILDLLGK